MKLNAMNESANRWNVTPKERVKLCDGEYWLPVNSAEIYFKVLDIYPNGLWNDCKRVFGTGKQTLSIEIGYDHLEEGSVSFSVSMSLDSSL